MFDEIDKLARIAAYVVQEELMAEALERGEFYHTHHRPGITLQQIALVFYKARAIYHEDKKLVQYAPTTTDEEQDRFKCMLSAVSFCHLHRLTGFEPLEDDVRIMRHLLGHIFSWRKHGKLSRRAREIAKKLKLIEDT